MIRALIIDDEEAGEQLLSKLIRRKHKEIQLVKPAYDMQEAISRIDEKKPELIFLDIRLGTQSGFDILERTGFKNYHVIFVTAYGQFALKAIKSSAIDYLLKPVDMDDLATAIERFKARRQSEGLDPLKVIKQAFRETPGKQKLVIPTKEGFEFVHHDEILYAIADENYATLYLSHQRSRFSSKNLGYFEDQLPDASFFRIHKSHLINLDAVMHYEHGNGGFVKMKDGKRLEVSRRKKKELLELMSAPVSTRTGQ